MRRALLLVLALCSGCLKGWTSDGPWACEPDGGCPGSFTCDDGVCCVPGGTPACPTLPVAGACPGDATPETYFHDGDGDGVGDTSTGRPFCRAPRLGGWVSTPDDCDDTDPFISPNASERCNALDDNCDGVVDDGLSRINWYRDDDHDSFGVNDAGLLACAQPDGGAPRGGDCDDANPARYPGAPELCDGIDNNCNGQPDDAPFEDTENPGINDGHNFPCSTGESGVCSMGAEQCVYNGSGFSKRCVPRVLPRTQTDVCGNTLDDDCDGTVDNQPGCGGPDNLVTARGVTVSAFRVLDAGMLLDPAGCFWSGGEVTSWLRPSWLGSHSGDTPGELHVLYATPPAGTWWDLSARTSKLNINVNASHIGGAGASFNVDDMRMKTLTVQFCGENGGWARATPLAGQRITTTDIGGPGITQNAVAAPLRASDPGWTVENHGLDWSHVTRLELLAAPYPQGTNIMTFTLTFASDGGFGFH